MTWKTFAGNYESIYLALLADRCRTDGIELTDDNLARQLNLHIHRGIAYLVGNKEMKSVRDLVGHALANSG